MVVRTTLKANIQSCLIRCLAGGDACAEECIMDEIGLLRPCANCWAEMGGCILARCALPCLAPQSAACQRCSEDNCFPDTVACTGVPLWAFPE